MEQRFTAMEHRFTTMEVRFTAIEVEINDLRGLVEGVKIQQVSFMNNGNVTMVTMFVENSKIQRAVDLQSCMICEMQLNVVLNVHLHVAVHSCTLQRNTMCISLSEQPVCVLYTVDTHTQGHTSLYRQCSTHSSHTSRFLQCSHTSRFPHTHTSH
jgi:hypothetical protein